MTNVRFVLSALAAAAALTTAPAAFAATPLTLGGGWTSFSFGGVGSSFSSEPFTFTLGAAGGTLKVTDAFLSGDQFEIFNGSSLGATSVPGSVGDNIGGDYDGAFADSRWSSGSWTLGAGSYSITGVVLASPFGSGGAAIELVAAAVPEPGTYALMALGLAGLGFVARRRKAV